MRSLLVAVAFSLSGCVGGGALTPAATAPHAPDAAPPPAFALVKVASAGGEPTIGATKDGVLYVAGAKGDASGFVDDRLLQSKDAGATWRTVGDFVHDAHVDVDPFLFADPLTTRVWNAPNAGTVCG